MKHVDPPTPGIRARMRKQARQDTAPELLLRRALHAGGYRFRVGYPVPGMSRRSIDIAFTKRRVAVFVDGCFWHACPQHATWPTSNAGWWREKLHANVRRDEETAVHLQELGWHVVRIWEHADVSDAVELVVDRLHQR